MRSVQKEIIKKKEIYIFSFQLLLANGRREQHTSDRNVVEHPNK